MADDSSQITEPELNNQYWLYISVWPGNGNDRVCLWKVHKIPGDGECRAHFCPSPEMVGWLGVTISYRIARHFKQTHGRAYVLLSHC